MAQFKRWPIGLQSGPGGEPTGIGDVIKALTENDIAMFSASSDTMQILDDLQNARIDTGVPHTGNFRPTGRVDGYDLEVPEYGEPPTVEGTIRHWDHVEKKGYFRMIKVSLMILTGKFHVSGCPRGTR